MQLYNVPLTQRDIDISFGPHGPAVPENLIGWYPLDGLDPTRDISHNNVSLQRSGAISFGSAPIHIDRPKIHVHRIRRLKMRGRR